MEKMTQKFKDKAFNFLIIAVITIPAAVILGLSAGFSIFSIQQGKFPLW